MGATGRFRANTVCELMKDGLRNCTILVNLKVLGMKPRHYPFRSLVHNCIDLSSVNRMI